MKKLMLIDASDPAETRVVVSKDDRVEEFDREIGSHAQIKGNIYLAKVTRVEPSLQAAFVDYGGNRHGFLPFSEIHPDYYRIPIADREALLAEEAAIKAAVDVDDEEDDEEDEEEERSSRSSSRRGRNDRRKRSGRGSGEPKTEAAESEEAAEPEAGDALSESQVEEPLSAEASDQDVAAGEEPTIETEDGPDSEESSTAEDAEGEPEEPGLSPESGSDRSLPMTAKSGDQLSATPQEAEKEAEKEAGQAAEEEADAGSTEDAGAARKEAEASQDEGDAAPPRAEDAGEPVREDAPQEPAQETSGNEPADEEADEEAEAASGEERPETTAEAAAEEDSDSEVEREGAAEAADDETEDDETEDDETAEADAKEETGAAAGSSSRRSRSRRGGRRSSRSRQSRGQARDDKDSPKEKEASASETERAEETEGRDVIEEIEQETQVDTLDGDEIEDAARRRAKLLRRYKIQEVIKRGQIMLVQVSKEERGNKGAALTTYLSLPGRYCVLMPNTARGGGISRKIGSSSDRKRLKQVLSDLEIPEGMAVIVRTAGSERSRTEIRRDYDYLIRLWGEIRESTLKAKAPDLIYEEGNIIKRAIRDLYTSDMQEILVEGEEGYKAAKAFMRNLMPSHARKVQLYKERSLPLFQKHKVETQLGGMFLPEVQLRSGGYLVINVTEALVAIDVNSGRATRERHIEETALKTNLEAADEVAQQLRLRDLAGLIVIDFIDMEENRHNREVERRLKEAMKADRARIQLGRISPFGLLELSRQRLRPSLVETAMMTCPHCSGTGRLYSPETAAMTLLRAIVEEGGRRYGGELVVTVPTAVALYLLNNKREQLAVEEERFGLTIRVEVDDSLSGLQHRMERIGGSKRPPQRSEARSEVREEPEEEPVEEVAEEEEAEEAAEETQAKDEERGEGDSRRRRRRGKRGGRRRSRRSGDEERSEERAAEDESGGGDDDSRQEEPETAGEEPQAAEEDRQEEAGEAAEQARPTQANGQDSTEEAEEAADEAAPEAAPEAEEEAPKAEAEADAEAGDEGEAAEAPERASNMAVITTPDPERPKRQGWWNRFVR